MVTGAISQDESYKIYFRKDYLICENSNATTNTIPYTIQSRSMHMDPHASNGSEHSRVLNLWLETFHGERLFETITPSSGAGPYYLTPSQRSQIWTEASMSWLFQPMI